VERLVAQRSFVVQRPATSQDAAGCVRALTLSTDALIEEMGQWLVQVERAPIGR
jgi:cholesterol transport system auxiliary component